MIQDFDEKTGKCVSQEFVAGDQVDWENENGEPVFEFPAVIGDGFNYFPFDMVQPMPDPEDIPSYPKEKPWDIPEKE